MEPWQVGISVFVGVLVFSLMLRVVVRIVDRRRIRHLAKYRGWTRVTVRRSPADRWRLFRRGPRCYRVDYFDELGELQSQDCRMGAGFTVLWSD